MFESQSPVPQNLPTGTPPKDMFGDEPATPVVATPQIPPTNGNDPHSGGFSMGADGPQNAPSALDAGKLRPVAPRIEPMPESVAGVGSAPLEDSLFSRHKVLFAALIALVALGLIAWAVFSLLLRDTNSNTVITTDIKEPVNNEVVPDAIVPQEEVVPEEVPVETPTTTPEVITPPIEESAETIDRDGDGLTESEEQAAGTDPQKIDTDGDGLTDKEEINLYLTMPTKADSDNDGFSDGVEIKGGFNPLGSGRRYSVPASGNAQP